MADASNCSITALPQEVTALVTVVKAIRPRRLAKRFTLVGGELQKQGAGSVAAGALCLTPASTPTALADVLQTLDEDMALIFGLPTDRDATGILSTGALKGASKPPPGVITRTADNFEWPSHPGWMMLDYDPPPGTDALSPDAWRETIYTAAPMLREAPQLWAVSASSEIYNAETGERLRGITGQRLYILVQDARDIPRAGQALFDRLWLAGHGYHQVSKAGSLLKRAPIDASVWQTNRLDFAAPPTCAAPLEARRPDPIVYNDNAPPVSTSDSIPPLTDAEQRKLGELQGRAAASPEIQAEREKAQSDWVAARLKALEDAGGEELSEQARDAACERLTSAVKRRRLFGDFELLHSSGQIVTVGDVLDNTERWHNQRFADPLEPDYGGDRRIAWLNLRSGGSPYLYSHAHGGQRFLLLRPTARLELDGGEGPQHIATVCERLKTEGDVFVRAGRLVRVVEGEIVQIEAPWLQTKIEGCFELWKYDARSRQMKRVDCPESLAKRVLAARGDWGLPTVRGVITFPVMRPDGTLLSTPGLDQATGLLFLENNASRAPAAVLEARELSAAIARIWAPFRLFPFADDLSRGVFLSLLLTTVCRPTLDTAPGYLIRAHAAGNGKTRLAECALIIAGARVTAMPLPDSADEVEKRLLAKLLTGTAGVLLDNIQGSIDYASLCAFMTAAEPEGRILGKTAIVSAANRALWILTGNNVSATGDTYRRILPITLDAASERPEARRFPFDPRQMIRERLEGYRTDLLSVLLTFVHAGAPQLGTGSLGSFEAWERLVRQCVVWLINEGLTPAPMADPADVVRLSRAEDPALARHAALLTAWHDLYGQAPVKVREVAALVNRGATQTWNNEQDARAAALVEAARDAAEIRGTFNARSFGWYLRRHEGVVVDGLRVDQVSRNERNITWTVTRVDELADA